MPSKTHAIEVHDLTVTYDRRPALWDIDLTLPTGQLIGIIGPNGAGKSTLIKSIMDLIPLSSGWTKIFDQPLEDVRDRVSYVPQRNSVDWDFPASVMDVVLMGRYPKRGLFRWLNKEDKKVALKALETVGMESFKDRQIAQLSGGQQQRVFLARALAQKADIYFMDEPFKGVDASTESAVLSLMKEMRSQGKTLIVVHHDLESAYEYFDWIVLLNTSLVAYGPKEKVFTPELLNQTYGGKLTMLDKIADLIRQNDLPIRETRR